MWTISVGEKIIPKRTLVLLHVWISRPFSPLADSSDTQATSTATADQFPGSEPIAEPITEPGHHTAVSPTPAASPCPPAETVRTYPMRSRRPPLQLYGTMDT